MKVLPMFIPGSKISGTPFRSTTGTAVTFGGQKWREALKNFLTGSPGDTFTISRPNRNHAVLSGVINDPSLFKSATRVTVEDGSHITVPIKAESLEINGSVTFDDKVMVPGKLTITNAQVQVKEILANNVSIRNSTVTVTGGIDTRNIDLSDNATVVGPITTDYFESSNGSRVQGKIVAETSVILNDTQVEGNIETGFYQNQNSQVTGKIERI
jgi:cytoskeletal protein CcmA (bactofilin family)